MLSWIAQRHRAFLLGLALVVVVLSALVWARWPRLLAPSLSMLAPISLEGHQRLLVVAPHCDDETLGAGGMIQAAARLGMGIRVVIETNGDGYLFATMEEFRRLFPRAQDYIHMGEIRQQESLSALRLLGLAPENVTFLSYPDRGTPSLWNANWLTTNPYRSPYIEATHSPYPISYNSQSVYAGQDLLADLQSILQSYQPDLILYPHPDDVHPDHWGLSNFVRLALLLEQYQNPGFPPEAYAYLVHRPDFPVPREWKPDQSLLPPAALFDVSTAWLRFDITQEEAMRKWDALQLYRSQLSFLSELFQRFIRRNELFERVEPGALPSLASGEPLNPSTWRDPQGNALAPVQRDPVKDMFVRDAVAGADLMALWAAQTADGTLAVCADLRGEAVPRLSYTLRVSAVTSDGVRQQAAMWGNGQPGAGRTEAAGQFICTRFALSDLGSPWAVALGAEVRGPEGIDLDQVAWAFLLVEPGPLPAGGTP
jgi:LmbE family N-acetylglucosaminyl deacetylase